MSDTLIKRIKTSQGEFGILAVDNFIEPDTVITVPAGGDIQFALDSLSGKWSSGTVTIQLEAGQYDTPKALTLTEPNMIKRIDIKGAGKSKTTINKTQAPNAYEAVLIIDSQTFVNVEGMTIKTLYSNNSLCIQNNGSIVKITDVSCRGAQQSGVSTYNNGETEIVSGFDITNSSKANFGILTSKGSKTTLNSVDTLSMTNCTTGLLSEMGAMTLVFYTKISTSGVSTKFSPTLNNHSGTGWNLGTEG